MACMGSLYKELYDTWTVLWIMGHNVWRYGLYLSGGIENLIPELTLAWLEISTCFMEEWLYKQILDGFWFYHKVSDNHEMLHFAMNFF